MPFPIWLRVLAVALAVWLGGSQFGRAADPVTYRVVIDETGNAELDAALSDSSLLRSLGETAPVGPSALIGRARADAERFTAALHSLGHYGGQVDIRIDDRPLDAPDLPDVLAAVPEGTPVAVAVRVRPGKVYPLRRVELSGDIPPAIREAFTLAPGQPARADAVLAAGSALRVALRDAGFAMAEIDPPTALLDPQAEAIDVAFAVRPGPRVAIGAIAIEGLERLDPDFVRRRLLLREGERYDPARIAAARRDLASLPVIGGVRITEGTALDEAGRLPVTIQVSERKRRAIDLEAGWSTDQGGRLSAAWTHRNLFGGAEQLTLSAAVTEIGGTAVRAPGYRLGGRVVLPDWLARDQSLTIDLGAERAYLRAYDRSALTASATVRRKLSNGWAASLGIAAQRARIAQEGTLYDYALLQMPLGVTLDTTNDLFDPTSGLRASLTVTPSVSFDTRGTTAFAIAQAAAATYLDVGSALGAAPGRSVLALRGLVGITQGGAVSALPPDQRFYAGGSATIRGYRFQSVGDLFPSGRPRGGNAINAGSLELRQRIGESWGAVAFIDAGQISGGGIPFTGDLRAGAGVGVRYYTAIGPIRVDVAVPLIRQPKTDALQLYIGIGQAF